MRNESEMNRPCDNFELLTRKITDSYKSEVISTLALKCLLADNLKHNTELNLEELIWTKMSKIYNQTSNQKPTT